MIKIRVCRRCGWEWASRRVVEKPKVCPKCKSMIWEKEKV